MNLALRTVLTVSDYLAWAEAQGERSRTELINGQIVAMSPEQAAHNLTKGLVFIELRRAMAEAGVRGTVFTDGMTVPIEPHTAYEPDALVRCGEPFPRRGTTVTDPVIVVEVLSPSSQHTDTSAKLIGYFKLPSVRHYLIIDPDARTVAHHYRAADGMRGCDVHSEGTQRLDPPGLAIDVATLFE
jgi:Uma2 family endonuclease